MRILSETLIPNDMLPISRLKIDRCPGDSEVMDWVKMRIRTSLKNIGRVRTSALLLIDNPARNLADGLILQLEPVLQRAGKDTKARAFVWKRVRDLARSIPASRSVVYTEIFRTLLLGKTHIVQDSLCIVLETCRERLAEHYSLKRDGGGCRLGNKFDMPGFEQGDGDMFGLCYSGPDERQEARE